MTDFTPESVDRTLRLGEDSVNEFKSVRLADQPSFAGVVGKALAGLANAHGGKLWFGVEVDGTPAGVGDRAAADRLMQRIDDAALRQVVPSVPIRIEKTEHRGATLVVAIVDPSLPDRPYQTKDGKYFVRRSTSTTEMTRDELRHLFVASPTSSVLPDEAKVGGLNADDVDDAKLDVFLTKAKIGVAPTDPTSRRALLVRLKILDGDALTVFGALCFARDPQRAIPWAYITVVRVRGGDLGADGNDRRDFRGTLDDQIAAAETWCEETLRAPFRVEGFAPEGSLGVPFDTRLPLTAVREAVRNAVLHRDYGVKSQIVIAVFDDRVEVRSPGRLMNSLTVDQIRLGAHVMRNNLLARFLHLAGFVTEFGTGILRMTHEMQRVGLPSPDFEQSGPTFVATLRLRARA